MQFRYLHYIKISNMKSALLSTLLIVIFQTIVFAQSASIPVPAPLNTATKATAIKITGEGNGFALGLKVPSAIISIDTSIKVAPNFAYLSIEMEEITGSSLVEIMNGSTYFWVNDKAGKPIKIGLKFLKKIKSTMENNNVLFVAKIPFKIETDKNPYTVRFRWIGPDKKKMIDYTVLVK